MHAARRSVRSATSSLRKAVAPVSRAERRGRMVRWCVPRAQRQVQRPTSLTRRAKGPVRQAMSPARCAVARASRARSRDRHARRLVCVPITRGRLARSPLPFATSTMRLARPPVPTTASRVHGAKSLVRRATSSVRRAMSLVHNATRSMRTSEPLVRVARSPSGLANRLVRFAKRPLQLQKGRVPSSMSPVGTTESSFSRNCGCLAPRRRSPSARCARAGPPKPPAQGPVSRVFGHRRTKSPKIVTQASAGAENPASLTASGLASREAARAAGRGGDIPAGRRRRHGAEWQGSAQLEERRVSRRPDFALADGGDARALRRLPPLLTLRPRERHGGEAGAAFRRTGSRRPRLCLLQAPRPFGGGRGGSSLVHHHSNP